MTRRTRLQTAATQRTVTYARCYTERKARQARRRRNERIARAAPFVAIGLLLLTTLVPVTLALAAFGASL